jgi:MFS transporter, UMF1 family
MPALILTTIVAVTATAGLTWGPIPLTFVLLGCALVAVNTGSVVYDALLPVVASADRQGRVSGLGVGVGYFGSFIGVAIGALTLDVLGLSHGITFVALAVGFLVFSLPTFALVHEPRRPPSSSPPHRSAQSSPVWRPHGDGHANTLPWFGSSFPDSSTPTQSTRWSAGS